MATKKSSAKKAIDETSTLNKIGAKIGDIAGGIAVKKDQLVEMATGAIDTVKLAVESVKSTIHDITTPKGSTTVADVKAAAKNVAKKTVKPATKKTVKAVVKKAGTVKKEVKKAVAKKAAPVKKAIKKIAKKAAPVKNAIKKAAKKVPVVKKNIKKAAKNATKKTAGRRR